MPAPAIYRSTDANAPPLFGGPGQLVALLDAILVDGYGSTFATGTITGTATNVSDGDTVTIGSRTYTFKTSTAAINQVAVGASAAISLSNLVAAINLGGAGSGTFSGTPSHADVWASVSGSVITLTARKGGTGGNSIALSKSAAQLTVSGATLTGGGGTNSKAGAGWTKPYSAVVGTVPCPAPSAVYRQPAGSGFYLQVDEGSNMSTAGGRDSRLVGFETMTAYNTGTGQFPTTAQVSNWVNFRKSTTQDSTPRAWIAFADDRTFYLFCLTGDAVGNYHGLAFGDFYSFLAGDAYKCMLMGGMTESASAVTSSLFGQHMQMTSSGSMTGHWLPRNFSGVGGSTAFQKMGDTAFGQMSSGTAKSINADASSIMAFPNQSDGGLYLAPLRIVDGSTPGTTVTGQANLRGRLRGLYQVCHQVGAFADGDTFTGSGDYAGRSFVILKYLCGSSTNQAFIAVETTAWDTSA